MFVDLRTRVPEKLLLLNNQTRVVQATNENENLKVYLYFSEPVLNSSADILKSINISQGTLLPINSQKLGNRRFGYLVSGYSEVSLNAFQYLLICLTSACFSSGFRDGKRCYNQSNL